MHNRNYLPKIPWLCCNFKRLAPACEKSWVLLPITNLSKTSLVLSKYCNITNNKRSFVRKFDSSLPNSDNTSETSLKNLCEVINTFRRLSSLFAKLLHTKSMKSLWDFKSSDKRVLGKLSILWSSSAYRP